tara:strand:+ start:875 stop:1522 length:648 start_codon:yes stop_codon:yes gene_type:complete
MLLLVGLGNPGKEHANNRHNVGFMALDAIAERHSFTKPRKRFSGTTTRGIIDDVPIIALKPLTSMNASGLSVQQALSYYGLSVSDLIVFHDELDLKLARIRVKRGGGNAGHNGLRDIDRHISTSYRRVRIGVDHPGNSENVIRYVLRDFPKPDRKSIDALLLAIAEATPLLISNNDSGFMNKIALLQNSDPPAHPEQTNTVAPCTNKLHYPQKSP